MRCVFCKIIKKEISSEIIYKTKEAIVIKDINPKASLHLIILPKKHIPSISHLSSRDKNLVGTLFLIAKKTAESKRIKGYKLAINVGKEGGQFINHLHIHLLAGKIREMP